MLRNMRPQSRVMLYDDYDDDYCDRHKFYFFQRAPTVSTPAPDTVLCPRSSHLVCLNQTCERCVCCFRYEGITCKHMIMTLANWPTHTFCTSVWGACSIIHRISVAVWPANEPQTAARNCKKKLSPPGEGPHSIHTASRCTGLVKLISM